MATVSDFPFDPVLNPTWTQVLASTVPGFTPQTFDPVLDTIKVDSSVVIDPLLIPQQVGAVWSNTVDTYMRVSWPAIVSILVGTGGNTFLGLADVDEGDYIGHEGDIVIVNAVPDGLEFADTLDKTRVLDGVTDGDGTKRFYTDTELQATVETREPLSTGVVAWTSPGMSIFDPSTVSFEAGVFIQITKTFLAATKVGTIWSAQNIVVSTISSRAATFFTVDTGGIVQQYVSFPSRTVLDVEGFLGVAVHDGSVIDRVIPFPRVTADLAQLVYDEINATGSLKVTAGGVVDETAAFTAIRRATSLFSPGLNFVDSIPDPNNKPFGEEDLIFDAVFQDGTVDVDTTDTFVKSFESAPGVLSALTGKSAVIHKIILLADGGHQVQYGNVSYSSFAVAADAIARDLIENPLNIVAANIGVLLAVAVINAGASDWALDNAQIFQLAGSGGAGGGGTGGNPALGDLIDVVLGSTTEGQVIFFDGTTEWNDGSLPAQFIFTFDGNIPAPDTDVGLPTFTFASKFLLTEVRIDVKTAPVSTDLQVDVLKNGTTVFSGGGPIISTSGFTNTKVPTPDPTVFVKNDKITIDISTGDISWQDLTVHVRGQPVPG